MSTLKVFYSDDFYFNGEWIAESLSCNDLILVISGYGRSKEDFNFLVGISRNILHISLPEMSHFQTSESYISEEGWQQIAKQLIDINTNQPIVIIAYSIGARIALKLCEANPAIANHIILIAPDGLKKYDFYNFMTNTIFGHSIFKLFCFNPLLVNMALFFSKPFKYFNHKKIRFLLSHVNTDSKRILLYNRWMLISKAVPIGRNWNLRKHVMIDLLFGKYDPIIPFKNALKFKRFHQNQTSIYSFELGHQLLKYAEVQLQILELIKENNSSK
jgi:pimeloyl-ACP methyl ester carboxylesterase